MIRLVLSFNAPVICIHAPTYGDSGGIAGLWCRASTFSLFSQCRGSGGVKTLGHLPSLDFL